MILLKSSVGWCQDSMADSIRKVVDIQIWQPFMESYYENDGEKFMDLHTKDVLRINKWGIKSGPEYRAQILELYAEEGRPNRTIEFKFEERTYTDKMGYEVGYYKVYEKEKGAPANANFGRFHVVIKKFNGDWKIAQDWDSNMINGKKINAADYDRLELINIKF